MVVWEDPSAKGINSKDLYVTCVPPSGSEFQIGKTEVNCTTGDDKQRPSTCSFTVTVYGKLKYV